MATVVQPASRTTPTEGRAILLEGVRWETYKALGEDLERAHSNVCLTYDAGSLEIVTHGWEHEVFSSGFVAMIGVLCEAMDIPFIASGSTTCQRDDLEKGFEPDQSFYFGNAQVMLGKQKLNLPDDPPPDLTIKVEITRTALDRMRVFAATGIPEVWCFNGKELSIYRLDEHREYVPSERSEYFPNIDPPDLVRFLRLLLSQDLMTWTKQFRQWTNERLAGREPETAE